MVHMKHFEKYQGLMADMMVLVFKPYNKDIRKGKKIDFGQGRYEFLLFEGFTEISNNIDTLKLINVFIDKKPPKDTVINYSNYLSYHIHNYFQEMYILKERLTTYGTCSLSCFKLLLCYCFLLFLTLYLLIAVSVIKQFYLLIENHSMIFIIFKLIL